MKKIIFRFIPYLNNLSLSQLVLLCIVLFFAGVRFFSLDWGMNPILHPNEFQYVEIAREFEFSDIAEKPSIILSILYAIVFWPINLIFGSSFSNLDWIIARFLTALTSLGTILLGWYYSHKYIQNKTVKLILPALLASSFLLIYEAQFIWMNTYVGFLSLISLFLSIKTLEAKKNSSILGLVLANILLIGLSIAFKYFAVFLAVPLLVAIVCNSKLHQKSKMNFVVLLAGIPISFVIFNPYWFFSINRGISSIFLTQQNYSTSYNFLFGNNLTTLDAIFNLGWLLLIWIGPAVVLVLSLFAVLFTKTVRQISNTKLNRVTLLASFVGSYLLFFSLFIATFGRHLIPAVIALMIIFTELIDQLMQKGESLQKKVLSGFVVFTLVLQTIYSTMLASQFWQQDERLQLLDWLNADYNQPVTILQHPSTQKWMIPALPDRFTVVTDPSQDWDLYLEAPPIAEYHFKYLNSSGRYNSISEYPDRAKQHQFFTELSELEIIQVADFQKNLPFKQLNIDKTTLPYHFWSITSPGVRVFTKQ